MNYLMGQAAEAALAVLFGSIYKKCTNRYPQTWDMVAAAWFSAAPSGNCKIDEPRTVVLVAAALSLQRFYRYDHASIFHSTMIGTVLLFAEETVIGEQHMLILTFNHPLQELIRNLIRKTRARYG